MKIVEEAKTPPPVSRSVGSFGWGVQEDSDEKEEVPDEEDEVEEEEDEVEEEEDDVYDKTVKEVQAWKI